jgi:hypothetical protein
MLFQWGNLSVTDRLRILRHAAGHSTKGGFAAHIGEDPKTESYSAAERSGNWSRRLNDKTRLVFPQLDVGWIWHGETGNMPQAFEQRLYEAARDLGLVGDSPRNRTRKP